MTQHYTRSTVEVSVWCRKCHKETIHRIDGVKLGPCKVCMTRPVPTKQEKKQAEQMTFERYGVIDL